MTGAALGGGAGSLARIYDHASGRVMIENQRADYRRWADTIEDADARARTDAYAFKLENYAPGSSALLADADAAARRTGGRIEIVDEAEMKRRVGSQKSSGAYLQDDNVVLLNLERFDKSATAHEVYHNLAKMVAGGEQLDIARQMIFGDAVSDPMFTPDSVRGVLEKYRDVLTGGAREEFNALIGRAFGDDLMVDGENVKIKAQNDLADEIMALHAGYSVFSRSKFKRKPRYNNALMRGGATRTDNIFVRFSTAMRRIFERKQRDMIELATDGNFKDTFNVDGVARIKSPGMDRFMREVMQNTKDVTDEGNAGKTRYQFKKSSPAKWDAMANAGLKSAFVMDGNGKPIRPKTVGEMDANSRAMFTSIEEAMRRNGIDRDAFLQPEDDGTTSFDLNAIRRSLMELPDGEEKFAQLLATMDRFLTQEQRDIIGKLGGSMANDLKQSFNLTYWSATSKKPKSETSVYNTLGVSERGVLPYQFRVSSEGGLYIKALDLAVLSRRFKKAYAANKGKDLFNSPEDAHKQFMEYLRNLTDQDVTLPIEQRTLSEDLEIDGVKLGVEKRNMFYEVLGTVPSQRIAPAPDRQGRPGYDPSDPKLINDRVTKSFRIDRMSRLSPTGKSMHFNESTYFGSQANLLPDGEVPKATYDDALNGKTLKLTDKSIARFLPATDKVNLADYADQKVVALAADRMGIGKMMVGPKGGKRPLSVEAQGGRGFMYIFNGGGWAFSDEVTAGRLLTRLSEDVDSDGNVLVGITIQSPVNHLKNQAGQLAYVETMQAAIDSKAITKKAADAQVRAMSDSIVNSTAKSIKEGTRKKFASIKNLKSLEAAVKSKSLNFADTAPLLTQMERKKLPITEKELSEAGITARDIAMELTDPELRDIPFGSVVALLRVNVKQKPENSNFHYAYPWTIHGEAVGYLDKFHNIDDLSTDPRIRDRRGRVGAQPLQTVMPLMDNIANTIKTREGIPSDPNARYLPDSRKKKEKKPLTEAEKIKKFASGLSTEEVRSRLAKMRLTPAKHVAQLIGEYPEYLDPVVDYIVQKRKDLVSGKIKPRDVAKAYWMTIASIGADAIDVTTLKAKADQLGIEFDPDPMFLSEGAQGQAQMRPEELAAWWLGTKSGQKALNGIVNGKVDKKAWEIGLSMRDAFGRNDFRDGYTKKGNYKSGGLGKLKDPKKQFNLTNLAALTNAINATRGDSAKLQPLLMKIKGIGEGKKGFIGHLVGMGDAATIDAVELNVWLTGKGETTYASKKMKERAAIGKVASGAKGKREDLFKRIRKRIDHLAKVAPGGDKIPKDVAPHIIHHWLWDAAKKTQTTHKGMYHAMVNYLPDSAVRQTKTPQFKKWFGKSKVVDDSGVPIAPFHASTHSWTVADATKTSTENDLGQGIYFTTHVDDANVNYSDEGADLTNRIEREAEKIQDSDPNIHYEVARDMAKESLHGGAPQVRRAFLKMENPVVIGGNKETWLTFEQRVDDDGDYIGEPEGSLVKYLEKLDEVAGEFDATQRDIDSFKMEVVDSAIDYDGIGAEELIRRFKENFFDVYDEYTGDSAAPEFMRRVFEESGFDGFIDETVFNKFGRNSYRDGMPGLEPDTVHYVVWDSRQIKSATGNRGTFDASNPDIRYMPASERTETQIRPVDLGGAMVTPEPGLISFLPAWHGTPHDVDQFRLNKIGTGEGVQAYGYGLYFAENVKVAEEYRDALAISGARWHDLYRTAIADAGVKNPSDDAVDIVWRQVANSPNDSSALIAKRLHNASRELRAYDRDTLARAVKSVRDRTPKGNLYKVELNLTDDNVLHWDLPFSKQPESVQLAILDGMAREGVTQETYKGILDEVERLADAANKADDIDGPENKVFNEAYRSQRYRMAEAIDRLMKPQDSFGRPAGVDRYTGNGVYDMLGRPKEASEFLLKNGVRGIKYADGMSRGARIVGVSPERTYNFVVFDESDIVITERNGERVSVEQASFLPDDADYMKAVEAGDMEMAQRMVDQAAKAAGYAKAFHGGRDRGKNSDFRRNFFFGSLDKRVASTYGDVEELFFPGPFKRFNAKGRMWSDLNHSSLMQKLERSGAKTLRVDNTIDTLSSYHTDPISNVVISRPELVKSADPVTRDANGNVIPLSERFNKSIDDIRFLPDDELRMKDDKDVPDEYKKTRPGTKARMLNSGRIYSPAVAKIVSDEMKGKAIDRDELDRIIERDIPIRPVTAPKKKGDLPSVDVIKGALRENQVENAYADATEVFTAGETVELRQDVPSWNRRDNRVGVVTVRGVKGKDDRVAYVPMVRVNDLRLEPTATEQKTAARIASGIGKVPTITATGTIAKKQSLPRDLGEWEQVGFNPDRHSYYYLRKGKQKGRPVVGAKEAIQIGNTIFVKGDIRKGDIRYGKRENFRFLPSEERVNIVDSETQRDAIGSSPNVRKRFSPGLTAARAYSSFLDAQRGVRTRD